MLFRSLRDINKLIENVSQRIGTSLGNRAHMEALMHSLQDAYDNNRAIQKYTTAAHIQNVVCVFAFMQNYIQEFITNIQPETEEPGWLTWAYQGAVSGQFLADAIFLL